LVREAPGFSRHQQQSDADVIASSYSTPLQFVPGSAFRYSNLGYFILAEIITVATNQHWATFIEEEIFRPAAMSETLPTSAERRGAPFANGYSWKNQQWHHASNGVALRPSGAFLSSVTDMAKWDAALYSDGVLPAATRAQMWAPTVLNDGRSNPYGFGWRVRSVNGHLQVSHGGSQRGFRAMFERNVNYGISVIVLTNSGNAKLNKLCHDIARLYIKLPDDGRHARRQ
jgi:CubicO group peptidase (beta-lactamase class C family)